MRTAQLEPSANSGIGYFLKGFELIRSKGIRRFVFVPLAVNLILFSVAFHYLSLHIAEWVAAFDAWLPDGWAWLTTFVGPLMYISALVIFSFFFSTFANWIAAPFNGLLSEKMEQMLAGYEISDSGFLDVVKDIPRTLKREWRKLMYYLPRAIGFFILLWLIPVFGQLIWFLFVAWMMAIQYCDYPFDNRKVAFEDMTGKLAEHKGKCFSFGSGVAIAAMIPIVNLVVMPVAICGATAMWVDHFQQDYRA
ncbi:sulfate transporter CysZ [Thalassotalea maritima]|uniref:sulfate transporter CysZ n=1 Tax=Thalassotalea maritima TaxID=3242416 RepID=UPI003529B90B